MCDYLKLDEKINFIIDSACKYMTGFDKQYIKQEILKAYLYAREAHEGKVLKSGEPYITHPVETALTLLHLKPDLYTIQSCLLYGITKDTSRIKEDIATNFGNEVAFLCSGMEKLSKVKYTGEDKNIGSLRKMFVAMAEDLRVIFIKLSYRLHYMRVMYYVSTKYKREKISLETLNIYSPIAERLGLYFLKNSLEEECFKILEPKDYKKLKKDLTKLNKSSKSFIMNAKDEIDKVISGQIFNYEIDIRVKSIYSIYKKMKRKSIDKFNELYDLFGIKIIVKDVPDCYKTLGVINNKWTPILKKFKDYIALPKPNGYKSLHTTVIGFLPNHSNQPIEIQIKTYDMQEYSDIGFAAHFEYKEKGSKIAKDIDWVKELKEITESLEGNDFMHSLKIDIFKDRIFAFTPKGKSINLPAGSTIIDFAYYVHTDLGNHISISKVNGKIHPLDKELHNGDVVEIITNNSKKPNPFWLSFVKTARAKNGIKNFLNKEHKELYREKGKEIMNKYLLKSGFDSLDKDLSFLRIIDDRENNTEERLQILERVGNFSITPSSLLKKIMKTKKLKQVVGKNGKSLNKSKKTDKLYDSLTDRRNIIIGGETDIPYQLCYCCRKKLIGQIVAHINSKGKITVHKKECRVLNSMNKDRLLSAYIEGENTKLILVKMNFVFFNKKDIFKELSEIFNSMNINIDEIKCKRSDFGGKTKVGIILNILDYDYLIIEKLIERAKINLAKKSIDFNVEKITKPL